MNITDPVAQQTICYSILVVIGLVVLVNILRNLELFKNIMGLALMAWIAFGAIDMYMAWKGEVHATFREWLSFSIIFGLGGVALFLGYIVMEWLFALMEQRSNDRQYENELIDELEAAHEQERKRERIPVVVGELVEPMPESHQVPASVTPRKRLEKTIPDDVYEGAREFWFWRVKWHAMNLGIIFMECPQCGKVTPHYMNSLSGTARCSLHPG